MPKDHKVVKVLEEIKDLEDPMDLQVVKDFKV